MNVSPMSSRFQLCYGLYNHLREISAKCFSMLTPALTVSGRAEQVVYAGAFRAYSEETAACCKQHYESCESEPEQ